MGSLLKSAAVLGSSLALTANTSSPLNFSYYYLKTPKPELRIYNPLPGHNIHLISEHSGNFFIRGGAPTIETLDAIFRQSNAYQKKVFVIDLRNPPRNYDLRPEGERLIPSALKAEVIVRGGEYITLSSFKKDLPQIIDSLVRKGDVYIGCHYGFNRTGYVMGRLKEFGFEVIDKSGLGNRDFEQGIKFQRSLFKTLTK